MILTTLLRIILNHVLVFFIKFKDSCLDLLFYFEYFPIDRVNINDGHHASYFTYSVALPRETLIQPLIINSVPNLLILIILSKL